MSNITTYINYFRNLAASNAAINHDPASETNDSAPGKKKFARWSAEEVITGLRTKLGWPALLIELYDTDLTAATVYDIKQRPKGAFTVLQHAGLNVFAEEEAAYDLCEEIVYDLLKQIWQHHHGASAEGCATPFKKFDFNAINIVPVGPLFDGCKIGYRVEFDFELHQTLNITVAPAPGKFV